MQVRKKNGFQISKHSLAAGKKKARFVSQATNWFIPVTCLEIGASQVQSSNKANTMQIYLPFIYPG